MKIIKRAWGEQSVVSVEQLLKICARGFTVALATIKAAFTPDVLARALFEAVKHKHWVTCWYLVNQLGADASVLHDTRLKEELDRQLVALAALETEVLTTAKQLQQAIEKLQQREKETLETRKKLEEIKEMKEMGEGQSVSVPECVCDAFEPISYGGPTQWKWKCFFQFDGCQARQFGIQQCAWYFYADCSRDVCPNCANRL